MKKIVTIVGARPQFIKAGALSRVLRKDFEEVLVHTGQHYDYNMSDIFFEELEIPRPNYNLGVSGGTHAIMTARMLESLEEVLIKEQPELVLVYGDTNSTLSGALAAVKLHIPICHVEAGNRLGTFNNPEEVNRIITDSISTFLMCCTESAVNFLKKEGKEKKTFLVGDPMYDAFLHYSNNKSKEKLMSPDNKEISLPKEFYYMTCHREENTKTECILEILKAMNSLEFTCIYPVHPRNQEKVSNLCVEYNFDNILLCKPVGYLTSIFLVQNAKKIITDSGGLQREAFFAKKQCVTVFDYVAWPETMFGNMNQLAKPDCEDILSKLNKSITLPNKQFGFGDGHSAEKICEILRNIICKE